MKPFISMLRGINVAGQNSIRMADLTKLYLSLGLTEVTTYLQSGNVVFKSELQDSAELGRQIEQQIRETFGFSVSVIVRSPEYFQKIIEQNPFLQDRNENLAALYVTFFFQTVSAATINNLQLPANETDEFSAGKDAVYLFCPNGYGRTKLNNTFFERKLKVIATTRNWNTLLALNQLGAERL